MRMTLSQFEIQENRPNRHVVVDDVRQQTLAAMTQELNVGTKNNPRDLVTNVDRANETFLNTKIRAFDPEAHSEEGFGDQQLDIRHVWFVDPIDGTMNLTKKIRFAIMIGLYR